MPSDMKSRLFSRISLEIRSIPELYPFRRPAILAFVAAVIAVGSLHWLGRLNAGTPWDAYAGQRCALVGVVRSQPDVRPTGVVYEVDAETIQPEDDDLAAVRGRLMIHVLTATMPAAEAGDRIRAFGRVNRPAASRTPGAFDYRAFLQARSIGAIAYAGPNGFQNLGRARGFGIRRIGGRIEHWVAGCFFRQLSPESAAVLAGLTVGERPRFYPEVRRAFIESGTMHVLVASGSNVGFILAALCILAAALGVPRETAMAASLPVIWLYVFVVGGDAPIARAGVMATLFVAAQLIGREDRAFHALAVAALALILVDPASLFDVGLQMSFLTVFGFLYHLPPIEKKLESAPRWARWLLRALTASMIAQLWLIPISAAVFHRLYPVSLIANLVIVPAASAGLGIGFILAALDAARFSFAASATARVTDVYGSALLHAARFFANHPGVSLWLPTPPPGQIAAFFLVILSAPFLRRAVLPRFIFVAGLAGLAFIHAPAIASTKSWGLVWLDTGTRCTAVLVDSRRNAVVINPGPATPADSSERILGPFFSEAGISTVQAVVVSDPRVSDADVAALVRVLPVQRVYSTTAAACLFGAWDPHGNAAPAAINVAGFRLQPLPSPPYAGERPLWISRDGHAALLGHWIELETQGAALEQKEQLDVVQARFRKEATWSPAFRRRYKPVLLVESAGSSKESVPPWKRVARRPQEEGWIWWDGVSAPLLNATRNRKSGGPDR